MTETWDSTFLLGFINPFSLSNSSPKISSIKLTRLLWVKWYQGKIPHNTIGLVLGLVKIVIHSWFPLRWRTIITRVYKYMGTKKRLWVTNPSDSSVSIAVKVYSVWFKWGMWIRGGTTRPTHLYSLLLNISIIIHMMKLINIIIWNSFIQLLCNS